MSKNITYILGAGASYHALPVVNGLTERFELFCMHFAEYIKSNDVSLYQEVKHHQERLIKNLKGHYTADTYAKKLFLQNPRLHTNEEYILLTNYLSAYFLYEQLDKNLELDCNSFLNARFNSFSETDENEKENLQKSLTPSDYRYDSFFASILLNDNNDLIVPSNFNFISWNYDFQFEKSFMNFANCNLSRAMDSLNVFGTDHITFTRTEGYSQVIKLNGSAGFIRNKSFGEIVDFSNHKLDKATFDIFKTVLTSRRQELNNGMRFSWEDSKNSIAAINLAKAKIEKSEVIVVIGYSFPYFNRKTDREIFSKIIHRPEVKVYLQCAKYDIDSVLNRFAGILPNHVIQPYSETDQFLIPNEMD